MNIFKSGGGLGDLLMSTLDNYSKNSAAASSLPTMPVSSPDDQAMQAAKKRSLAEMIARRGRASTILTSDNTEKLGV